MSGDGLCRGQVFESSFLRRQCDHHLTAVLQIDNASALLTPKEDRGTSDIDVDGCKDLLSLVGESFMRICSTVRHQGHGQSLSSSSIHMPPPLRSIGQPLGSDKVTPVRQPFGSRSSHHLTANHITATDTLREQPATTKRPPDGMAEGWCAQ